MYGILFMIAFVVIAIVIKAIPWECFNIKVHWFHIAFSIMSGVLGFIIVDLEIGWKIAIGIVFLIVGWFVAMFLNYIIRRFVKNNTIIIIICIIICVLMGVFAVTREYGEYIYKDPYEDVWDKDPNKWTEDEKDYVNDFWEWESKKQEKSKY